MATNPLRVCYFGTYRANYSRNEVMIAALRASDVQVIECNEPLWGSVEDRVRMVKGGWAAPRFLLRVLQAYWHLIVRFFKLPDFDMMVVGYPGQFDVFLARSLCWLRKKPLVWDILMSIYLIALERGLDKDNPITVGFLRITEWFALRLPDLLIQDTAVYVAWLEQTYKIPKDRFCLVPIGADNRIFSQQAVLAENNLLKVLYYGSYIPNHHVQTIIDAAKILRDKDNLIFELIGDGPDRPIAQDLVDRYQLNNVSFIDWLPRNGLAVHIAHAGICLGAFGVTPQSLMTVHNKIYECTAMAKPVITGDSAAVRQAFLPGEEIWVTPRQNPEALAEAIEILASDPDLRRSFGEKGYERYLREYSLEQLGKTFANHLRKFLETRV